MELLLTCKNSETTYPFFNLNALKEIHMYSKLTVQPGNKASLAACMNIFMFRNYTKRDPK
jgi:hypothetical protein